MLPPRPAHVLKRTKASRKENLSGFLHSPAQRKETTQADRPNPTDAWTKHKSQLTDPGEDRLAAREKSFGYSAASSPAQHDAGNICSQAGLHGRGAATE